jgi:hypothetical protein
MPQLPIHERDILGRLLIKGEENRSSARHAIVTGRQFIARRSLRAVNDVPAGNFYFVSSRER